MELSHGRLKLDVPHDWLDQSTLLFVRPRGGAEAVPAVAVTPTLSVRFAYGAFTARELVDAEVAGLERVGESELESPLGKGCLVHVRATLLDEPIEQLAVAWVVGDVGVIACAACGGREMKDERARLEELLRAIRLG